MKKTSFILIAVVFLSSLFLGQEFYKQIKLGQKSILIEANSVLLKGGDKVILLGENTQTLSLALSRMVPYFKRDNWVLKESEIPLEKETYGEKSRIQKLSDKILLIEIQGTKFIYLKKDFLLETLMNSRASLESDFWILETKKVPVIPFPKEGIIILGQKKIAKEIEDLGASEKITLFKTTKTDIIQLEFLEAKWKIHSKK